MALHISDTIKLFVFITTCKYIVKNYHGCYNKYVKNKCLHSLNTTKWQRG